jgi:hypothetical protein
MTNKLSASYLESQAKDGWWPYVAGRGPSVEATAWCAIACRKNKKLAQAAISNLVATQNSDGGWTSAPDTGKSDWSTGAALLAIAILGRTHADMDGAMGGKVHAATDRGLKFLVGLRTDLITDLTRVGLTIMQGPDFDYPRGWPWEPDTYHWVEPTSYAILAIKYSPYATDKRYKTMVSQAHAYLLEKTCTPAGWNFGSPRTLGADWPALPGPTALALIAMQDVSSPKIDQALAYLRDLTGPTIDTTIADSLSVLARDLHGDDMSKEGKAILERFSKRSDMGQNLCSLAAAAIACNLPADGNPFKFTAN